MAARKTKNCTKCDTPKPPKCFGCGHPLFPSVSCIQLTHSMLGVSASHMGPFLIHMECLELAMMQAETIKDQNEGA